MVPRPLFRPGDSTPTMATTSEGSVLPKCPSLGHFFWWKCLGSGTASVNTRMEDNNAITLQDLDEIRSILDVAARRGAFHANEMSQVGRMYDKLNYFLNSFAATTNAEQQEHKGESQ